MSYLNFIADNTLFLVEWLTIILLGSIVVLYTTFYGVKLINFICDKFGVK